MPNTKYVSAAAGLLMLAVAPAFAWSDSGPHNPNSIAPQPVTNMPNTCLPGMAPVTSGNNVFCDGTPVGQFIQVDKVPAGYSGRVFYISPTNGSGHQGLGW